MILSHYIIITDLNSCILCTNDHLVKIRVNSHCNSGWLLMFSSEVGVWCRRTELIQRYLSKKGGWILMKPRYKPRNPPSSNPGNFTWDCSLPRPEEVQAVPQGFRGLLGVETEKRLGGICLAPYDSEFLKDVTILMQTGNPTSSPLASQWTHTPIDAQSLSHKTSQVQRLVLTCQGRGCILHGKTKLQPLFEISITENLLKPLLHHSFFSCPFSLCCNL